MKAHQCIKITATRLKQLVLIFQLPLYYHFVSKLVHIATHLNTTLSG